MKLSELVKEAKDVELAAVPETNTDGSISWFIYLINVGENTISNVLIQSNGRGEIDAWPVKTSTLRHFIEKVEAKNFSKIEMIMEEVFFLENQYWVSFYVGTTIFDSRLVFKPNTIATHNALPIALLETTGVIAERE